MNRNRLETFSDGVLAIIITIMVLELKVPHGTSWSDLLPSLPVFGSYIMSFVYLGSYWGNHHHLAYTIERVNGNIIWANLNLLFWLSLVPFATQWMGESGFAAIPLATYAILMLLCSAAMSVFSIVVSKSWPAETPLTRAIQHIRRKAILTQSMTVAAIPLAFVSTVASFAILLATGILWMVPIKSIERAFAEGAQAAPAKAEHEKAEGVASLGVLTSDS